jgi:hypothetical protein
MSMTLDKSLSRAKIRRIHKFGRNGNANAHLVSGWGAAEDGFVWSEGKCAVINLPLDRAENVLSLSVWGYAPAGRSPQEVLVFADGLFKGFFEIHDKVVIDFKHDFQKSQQDCEIVFYLPAAISPIEAEGLPDGRKLGIALAAMQIE